LGFTLSEDILRQAQAVGGDLNPDFDRQTSTSETLPFYSVVGRNSKDSSYRGELNGKSVEISRAGEFRRKNGEGTFDYSESLELVIIDARTSYALWEDEKIVARGISTQGFTKAVWTDGKFPAGTSCDTSPYNRFTWEKLGGKEGRCLDPDTGKVITKEDLANCQLQLWCWDVAADEYCVVSFSAGALRHYREFVRLIECQGVKMHSLLWCLRTLAVDNGASAAPSYVPDLSTVRVLTPDEFAKADEKRAELVVKALKLSAPDAQVLPPAKKFASIAEASAFSSPPTLETAVADPSDPFVTA
jgi:hypothetical protein